ncbi:globin domain-containing protein [Allokutzneria oryzae]|uniref:nitric oxide dioxygenase n=1 Tax=Allokutzneria oryzae TaxID=1378989 RepID=A0ABV5ZX83_9PSEU
MLSQHSRGIVLATLPAVRRTVAEIAGRFYDSLFDARPDLLNLFNLGNQANGEQRKALAASVVAFAEHLTGTTVIPIDAVVRRVAHKHVSLGIRPEQYTIVGRYLLAAVADVLGDAVTPEVAAAWDEVYWLFAVRLIAAETRLYQGTGQDRGYLNAPWTVVGRFEEAQDTVSLALAPDNGPIPRHLPGQYTTVTVDLPNGMRQARQYTLSEAPGHNTLRITVRRVRGRAGAPDGMVSTFLTRDIRIGDRLRVSHPGGDVALPDTGPLVLASAGIGITPIAAMIEHLAETQPDRPVVAVHAERSPKRHALAWHVHRHGARLASFENILYYEQDAPSWARSGLVAPDALPLPPGASAYLCGPLPFMRHVRAALLRRGMPTDRIRFEVFGPDLWTTGADRLPAPQPIA